MHKVLAVAALAPALLGAIAIGFIYYGFKVDSFSGDNAMPILGLELSSFLFAIIGFGLSTMAYMIANRNGQTLYPFNRLSIVISLLTLVFLVIGLGFL